MSRAASNEAQQAQSTAAGNAATYGSAAGSELGPLTAGANSLIGSTGYDPATLSAISNAGMGGVNAAFGGAQGQIARNAARTNNPAGTAGAEDTLAMQKGQAGGQEAGDIQIQNANFANQQRQQGLNLLGSLYGTNTGVQLGQQGNQTQNIQAQTAASPGWVQNLTGILGAVSGGAGQVGAAAIKNCWIAAKIFGGWEEPRTLLVRDWIWNDWAKKSIIGHLVANLYEKYGERASESPFLVKLLTPLFFLALRKAEHGRH